MRHNTYYPYYFYVKIINYILEEREAAKYRLNGGRLNIAETITNTIIISLRSKLLKSGSPFTFTSLHNISIELQRVGLAGF